MSEDWIDLFFFRCLRKSHPLNRSEYNKKENTCLTCWGPSLFCLFFRLGREIRSRYTISLLSVTSDWRSPNGISVSVTGDWNALHMLNVAHIALELCNAHKIYKFQLFQNSVQQCSWSCLSFISFSIAACICLNFQYTEVILNFHEKSLFLHEMPRNFSM